jgi:hypothetical protein
MPPQVTPDVVKLPAGTNLGTVSFYDAEGSTDRLDCPVLRRLNHFTSIMDTSGRDSPLFVNPRIDVAGGTVLPRSQSVLGGQPEKQCKLQLLSPGHA